MFVLWKWNPAFVRLLKFHLISEFAISIIIYENYNVWSRCYKLAVYTTSMKGNYRINLTIWLMIKIFNIIKYN